MSTTPNPWPFLDPEQYDWARGTVAAWRRWQAGTDRYQQDWFYMEAAVALENEEQEKARGPTRAQHSKGETKVQR